MKLLKATLAAVLFMMVTVNQSNAAFPTEKAAKTINNNAVKTAPIVTNSSKKEVKKEIKALVKQARGGGGKSKILAAVLAFFLGGFGIHSFYMGQTKKGLIQLGLSILGIVLLVAGMASFVSGAGVTIPVTAIIGYVLLLGVNIWAFVDFIRILTGGLEPEEGFDS